MASSRVLIAARRFKRSRGPCGRGSSGRVPVFVPWVTSRARFFFTGLSDEARSRWAEPCNVRAEFAGCWMIAADKKMLRKSPEVSDKCGVCQRVPVRWGDMVKIT